MSELQNNQARVNFNPTTKMSKEDKTKDWIEHMVGEEIIDYKIESTFDTEGNVISYDIMIQPKQSLTHIEIPITIMSTSKLNQNEDE
jgi:hypothetical protein